MPHSIITIPSHCILTTKLTSGHVLDCNQISTEMGLASKQMEHRDRLQVWVLEGGIIHTYCTLTGMSLNYMHARKHTVIASNRVTLLWIPERISIRRERRELKGVGKGGRKKGWRRIKTDIIRAQGGDTCRLYWTTPRALGISLPEVKLLWMANQQG